MSIKTKEQLLAAMRRPLPEYEGVRFAIGSRQPLLPVYVPLDAIATALAQGQISVSDVLNSDGDPFDHAMDGGCLDAAAYLGEDDD